MKVGDRARLRRGRDTQVGVITARKERGVAGSDVTYFEWIEITYDDGSTHQYPPSAIEVIDDD